MSELAVPTAAPPLTDPTCVGLGNGRAMYGQWLVGDPGDDGYQAYAQLTVTHDGAAGYSARLGIRSAKTTTLGTAFRSLVDVRSERIAVSGPSRDSRATLATIFVDAVAEIRRRFQADDEAVTVYFDRSSEIFAQA